MEQAPQPPAPPVDKPKGRPSWLIPLLIGAAALVIGVGIGQSGGDETPVAAASPTPTGLTEPDDGGMVLDSPEPEPEEPVYDTLTAKDLEIRLKLIESDCFGSAGDLRTFRLDVGIDGTVADTLDPAVQWDVTYQITGDEDGPVVGTFTIYPDGQYDVMEETIGAPICNGPKPRITITDVEGF